MATHDEQVILNVEPCVVTDELHFWRDVRENQKDKLVWEFENCEICQYPAKGIDARTCTEAGLGCRGS